MSKGYILVVDDEPDIRETVRDILEDEAYQVGVAQSGKVATRGAAAYFVGGGQLLNCDLLRADEELDKAPQGAAQAVRPARAGVLCGHMSVRSPM